MRRQERVINQGKLFVGLAAENLLDRLLAGRLRLLFLLLDFLHLIARGIHRFFLPIWGKMDGEGVSNLRKCMRKWKGIQMTAENLNLSLHPTKNIRKFGWLKFGNFTGTSGNMINRSFMFR